MAYITIQHEQRKKSGLSLNEYAVADIIGKLSLNPDSKHSGWCYASKEYLSDMLDLGRSTVFEILNRLEKEGWLERRENGWLRLSKRWYEEIVQFPDSQPSRIRTPDSPESGLNNNIYIYKDTTAQKISAAVLSREPEPDCEVEVVATDEDGYVSPKKGPNAAKAMKDLIKWANDRRKRPFVNLPKQYKAMARIRAAGLSPGEIKERWIKMEDEEFWQKAGFDFMDIANSFDKK